MYLEKKTLYRLMMLALPAQLAVSQENNTQQISLEPIVVVGESGKFAEDSDVIINKIELEQSPNNNLRQLFRNSPGVEFEKNIGGTLGSIRIRGMGGASDGADRVAINIDGVPISDSFVYGHVSNNGQSTFDMTDLKAVEIKKGAAKTDGSRSGLAGTVNFTTKDPSDYIKENNKFGGNVRAGYDSSNDMISGGFSIGAMATDQISAMLSYTYRDFHEASRYDKGLDIIGNKRTAANPLDGNSHNIIGKFVFAPNDNHQFKLKLENFKMNTKTHILDRDQAQNKDFYDRFAIDRKAISLKHDFKMPTFAFDGGEWQFYHQQSTQDRDDDFTSYSKERGITSAYTTYEVKETGLNANFKKQIGDINELNYGFRIRQTDVLTRLRYQSPGSLRIYQNQPDTVSRQYSFYLGDDISLVDDRLHILPAFELTHYSIEPQKMEKFFGTTDKTTNTSSSWSLASSFDFNDNHQLFASYRHGLKVPSFVEQNRGAISAHGLSYIPNPNLKPEYSDSLEIGLKSQGEIGSQTISAFHDNYKNFIGVQTVSKGVNQVYNSPYDVTIYGVEYQGVLSLDSFSMLPQGLKLKGALSYSKAQQESDNGSHPYTASDPLNGNIALAYDAPSGNWGAQWTTHFSAAKNRRDIAPIDLNPKEKWATPVQPVSGYGFSDLTAYYKPINDMLLTAGVYNVFDKKYAVWSETIYDEYDNVTEPGRTFAVNLRYSF